MKRRKKKGRNAQVRQKYASYQKNIKNIEVQSINQTTNSSIAFCLISFGLGALLMFIVQNISIGNYQLSNARSPYGNAKVKVDQALHNLLHSRYFVSWGFNDHPHLKALESYDHPRAMLEHDVFTAAECEKIIGSNREDMIEITSEQNDQESAEKYKVSRHFMMKKLNGRFPEEENAWVWDRIMKLIMHLNKKYWNYDMGNSSRSVLVEDMYLIKYAKEHNGHYEWHMDVGTKGIRSKRLITVYIFLNSINEYRGGTMQLRLNGIGKENYFVEGDRGSSIIFGSFIPYSVRPVTEGERYVLVQRFLSM